MRLYTRMLDGEAGVVVPDTLEDLCTDRLLTMTWLEGRPLLDALASELDHGTQVILTTESSWDQFHDGISCVSSDWPAVSDYETQIHNRERETQTEPSEIRRALFGLFVGVSFGLLAFGLFVQAVQSGIIRL